MTWSTILGIMAKMVAAILPVLTPAIKEELAVFLKALYKKSVETPNVWDDFLVGALMDILSIPKE